MSEESLSDTRIEIDDIKDEIEYLKNDIKEIKSGIAELKEEINEIKELYASKFKKVKESIKSVSTPAPPVEKKKSVPSFFLISKYTPNENADEKKLYLKINIAQMTSLHRPSYKSVLENQFFYKENIENSGNLYQDLRNFLYFTKKVDREQIKMENKKITLPKTFEKELKSILNEFFNEK